MPADGVVIAVGATGVCRSDWHAWQGHDPGALPHIGGHEFAGVVAATGAEVTRWRAGDRVTVPFACGCGTCEHCLARDAQVCPRQTQPGFTGPGSFAEFVTVHAADANPAALPAAIDFVTPRPAWAAGSPPRSARWPRTAGYGPGTGWPCTAAAGSGCPR